MRRAWSGLLLLALALGGPVQAQDAAAAQRLMEQIQGMASSFWPDAQVAPNRGSIFRGRLEPARAALDELAALGEAAIPALAQLLRHPRAHLRANAAAALGKVGGTKAVGPLLGAADDTIPGVRYQVALALGYTSSAQALNALNKLAGDKDPAVRNAAIQTGAVLRDILSAEQAETADARFAELVKLSANDAAVAHLVRIGPDAVPALIAALDSDDKGIVSGAGQALARIGDTRGLEPLWKHFEASLTKTPETKFAAALAAYQCAAVWDYLVKLLDTPAVDPVPVAQYYALERLQTIEHADKLAVVHRFLERQMARGAHKEVIRGPETEVSPVAAAAETLARIGDKSSLPLLDKLIGEAPPPEKSIVKPLAEKAKAAITSRAG